MDYNKFFYLQLQPHSLNVLQVPFKLTLNTRMNGIKVDRGGRHKRETKQWEKDKMGIYITAL